VIASLRRRGGCRQVLWLGIAVLLASGAGAAERRVESVGAAPLGAEAGNRPARDLALVSAVDAAVLRVARDLLPEDFAPPAGSGQSPERWLAGKLGDDLLVYASQFSILEDRGQRPAVFSSDPGVESEYVVLAAVRVDVDALRDQLGAQGLLKASSRTTELRLVVQGLEVYRPLALLRQALEEQRGVRSVTPVEFTPGQAVLAVVADRSARELVSDLEEAPLEGLQVVPVRLGEREATLLVDRRE